MARLRPEVYLSCRNLSPFDICRLSARYSANPGSDDVAVSLEMKPEFLKE